MKKTLVLNETKVLIPILFLATTLLYGHTAYTYQSNSRVDEASKEIPFSGKECSSDTKLREVEEHLKKELSDIHRTYTDTAKPQDTKDIYEERLRSILGCYFTVVIQAEHSDGLEETGVSRERVQIMIDTFMQSDYIALVPSTLVATLDQYSHLLTESFIIASTEAEKN